MTQEIITITVEAGQMTARRKTLKIAQRRPVPVWAIVKYAALTIAGIISSEQCAEWTRHVMNVKNMTAKWRKQDRERFAALQQNRGITPRR